MCVKDREVRMNKKTYENFIVSILTEFSNKFI